MKTSTEKYTYGSVSTYDNRVFLQDYADPETGEDVTGRLEVQVDNDGVYIESKDSISSNVTECLSIPTHDLAVAAAKYILEKYEQNYSTDQRNNKDKIIEKLDFLDRYSPVNSAIETTIAEIRALLK